MDGDRDKVSCIIWLNLWRNNMILFPSTSASAFFSFFLFFLPFLFFLGGICKLQLPLIDNSIYETTELPFDQSLMTVPFKHAFYFIFFLYISTLNWSMDASIKPLFLWSGNSASGYKISHCRCQTAGAWTDFNLLIILFSTFVLFFSSFSFLEN